MFDFQQLEKDADHFGKTSLTEVQHQGQALLRECSPVDGSKLSEVLQGRTSG